VKQLVIRRQRNVRTLVLFGTGYHAHYSAYPRDLLYEKGGRFRNKMDWIAITEFS